jgi:hypothetical protein
VGLWIILLIVVVGVTVLVVRRRARQRAELADALAEARRWTERLGGQVLNLTGTDTAAKQAMTDAAERYTAAGSQLNQARTPQQARLVTHTALEGLYYVRAARVAMGLDPGPDLPAAPGQGRAGSVSEDREAQVEGRDMLASPRASDRTPYYYPGGMVSGRPVPQGWYSEPWWKTALVAGAWGVGSFLVFDALFAGMPGIGYGGWDSGYAEGFADGQSDGDGGGGDDGGGDGGDPGGGDSGGDWGGGDPGGGDWGGGGDFGGGDF